MGNHDETLCKTGAGRSSTRHEEYGQKVSFAHVNELVAGLIASMSSTHRHITMGLIYSPSISLVYSSIVGAQQLYIQCVLVVAGPSECVYFLTWLLWRLGVRMKTRGSLSPGLMFEDMTSSDNSSATGEGTPERP